MLGATMYLMVILVLNPYIRQSDDALHQLVQVELILMILVAFIVQSLGTAQLDSETDGVLSALLIIITCALILAFVGLAFMQLRKLIRKLQRRKVLMKEVKQSSRIGTGSGSRAGSPSLGSPQNSAAPIPLTIPPSVANTPAPSHVRAPSSNVLPTSPSLSKRAIQLAPGLIAPSSSSSTSARAPDDQVSWFSNPVSVPKQTVAE